MRDAYGTIGPIDHLPVTEARRTLGVRLAPDGNNKEEYTYLRTQAQNWQEQLRTGHLPRHLAWQALQSSLLPKLKYPLPATTFSRQACNKILSPALLASLPASGIMRTFPRTLVHAPTAARGLNIPDLYTEQGLSHIEMLLMYGHREEHITGKLLRGSIQQAKLELGLPGPLFRQDYSKFHHLATTTWVKSVWLFLWEHSMSLEEDGPHLTTRRDNDTFLTLVFYANGFRGKQLHRLNHCRVYLRMTTLADITTRSGSHITI